ncbi:MAG: hypothetical protein NC412_00495 [Roseburia sp.]|nr:hypothetical protein [Roseburia sp.]MCM1278596.1 hypothetical protein [Robinsoniella sp.]
MKAILRLYKRIFRYPLAAWSLFISFVVGYLCIFYGTKLLVTMKNEREHKERYSFANEQGIFLQSADSESRLEVLCEEKEYHIVIQNFYIYYDKEAGSYPANIVMNTNGEEKYPIIKGQYPDEEILQSGEKIVLLGRGLKEKVYGKEGKEYIEIFSEEYQVIGYISDVDTVLYDYQAVLFYDNLGKNLKEELKAYYINGIEVLAASDTAFIDGISLFEKLQKAGFLCSGASIDSMTATGIGTNSFRMDYLALIYVFGMLNCMAAERFCLIERMGEITIRKVHGFSRRQLVFLLYKELAEILIPASLAAAFFSMGINPLLKGILAVSSIDVLQYWLFTLLFLLLSAGIIILLAVYPLKKHSMAELFRKEGGMT